MDLALIDHPHTRAFAAALQAREPSAVVHQFPGPQRLLGALRDGPGWTVVVLPADQLELIAAVRQADPVLPVVAVFDRASVELATRVTEAGASDLLVVGDRLDERVRTLLAKLTPWLTLHAENRRLRTETEARWALVGESAAMVELRVTIARVARIPRPVLILGERGTGKELVARALHGASRRVGPLVAVNCAAFPDALLETELFGHERGAYTGADRRASGKFEQADGGTLFLDEIGSMSLPFQQKILRVVEYGELTRVGGSASIRSSARVVAATNADLVGRVAEGSFLPDLYDRLAFEVIRVPPLRERGEDLGALARWFLEAFQAEIGSLPPRTLSAGAIEALHHWSFPGNVRELKHLVERAAYRPGPVEIGAEELGLDQPQGPKAAFDHQVESFKRQLLQSALERSGGNQAAAARLLGLSYDQFRWHRKRVLGA